MKRLRVPIWQLMLVVILFGLGFAALTHPTDFWADTTYTIAFGLLLFSILGVAYRQGDKRRFWAAYAVFGWGYLGHLLATGVLVRPDFLTSIVIYHLDRLIVPIPPNTVTGTLDLPASFYFSQIAHSFAVILAGLFGTLAVRVFGTKRTETELSGTKP